MNHTAHGRGVGGEVNLPPAADDDKKRGGGLHGLMKKELINDEVGGLLFHYAPERDDRIFHL